MEIRAIYWDVGGVLLTNGWDHRERERVLARFEVPVEEFEPRHAEANDLWEKGELSDEQYLQRTVFFKPRSFSPQEFLAAIRAESQWLPGGARQVLADLRGRGETRLVTLNNESGPLNDYRIATFGMTEYFDAFFCSAYLGMRKPDPRMFEAGIHMLALSPGQCAFIDDRESNCRAAASAGMHAIPYKGEESLRTSLEGLGVRLG
jgi:putative hydrolase of the HAD superfamily